MIISYTLSASQTGNGIIEPNDDRGEINSGNAGIR